MFGKRKDKIVESIPMPKEVEKVDLEISNDNIVEDIKKEQGKVIEEPIVQNKKERLKEMQEKLKELETQLAEEEKADENFATVSAIELIGQGIFKYTLISTKPIWEIGAVLKI